MGRIDTLRREGQTLSIVATNKQVCCSCKKQNSRSANATATELMYPKDMQGSQTRVLFSQILKNSVEREILSKGWCAECKRYLQIFNKRTVRGLPDVFVLNTMANTPDRKKLWATPGWLPTEVAIISKGSQLYCYERDDVKVHRERNVHNISLYSLVGVATSVEKSETNEKTHMVATVNSRLPLSSPFSVSVCRCLFWLTVFIYLFYAQTAGLSSSDPSNTSGKWMLMNDFLVQPISEKEALTFTESKIPAVVVYQASKLNHTIDDGWKGSIDTSLLYVDEDSQYVSQQPLSCWWILTTRHNILQTKQALPSA